MTISSVGDLAISTQLRRDTARTSNNITRLTSELSSGVSTDLATRFKGDFGALSGLERGISRSESFKVVIAEQRLVFSTQQATLEKLRGLGELAGTFLTLPESANATLIDNAGAEALASFNTAFGSFNAQIGGKTIFSGVDTDRPALEDAEIVLSAIEAELVTAGAATASDVETVVTAWFSVGGGFDTVGYLGGPEMNGTRISESETTQAPITAAAQEIRDQFAALTLGALLGRNVLSGNLEEQGNLIQTAAENLLAASEGLVSLQSRLGTVENQIERASVEVTTEGDALQLARASLIEIDPYEAAIELQGAETQLQAIYAITARLSRLSLVDYI